MLLGVVAGLVARLEATEAEKQALECIKSILDGRNVTDVEQDLAAGVVKKITLDKIEELNKDLTDTCLEHIKMYSLVRVFWKHMAHIKIERDKTDEHERPAVLQTPVVEG